ncbi:MAG: nitrogenase cofactor biosynthesis protein NifB [Dehalococcoidia bacterium]|nr:nitrogenase cofactor biosynthesis protein NifB [Dehalococcoidia bacterium]
MDGCKVSCHPVSGEPLPSQVEVLIHDHPCYSEEAHYHYARMHLPVAPACNIQCRYCNRLYDCVNESRPGVTSEVLSPQKAAQKVQIVARRMPQVSVVGVAGPGDPLANPEKTFQTFQMVSRMVPDVRLCLSTNGLALLDHVDVLKELGVDHVTITINAIDPQIGKEIYQWVHFDRKRYTGQEAAAILIERQLAGLEALSQKGILCKVNSVLIPGVNDEHLQEVSKTVKSLGAFLHNIMPLIVVSGTDYAARGFRGPTLAERKRVQELCGGQVRLMHHCRQCRSDAIGLLSEDLSQERIEESLTGQEEYGPTQRQQARQKIEEDIQRIRAVEERLKESSNEDRAPITAAVASKGHGVVNEHFGHAKEFLVYEASGSGIKLVQVRKIEQYCRGPATCGDEEDLLDQIANMLSDCQHLLCSRIGPEPRRFLEARGIKCVETHNFIHEALADLVLGESTEPLMSTQSVGATS